MDSSEPCLHHLPEMGQRHRLGFTHPVNIDKASQGIFNTLCFEGGFEGLEFGRELSHEGANEVELGL